MESTHAIHVTDARELSLPADSVELVVTSPPYPMIEMWDELFSDLDPAIADRLDAGEGWAAFDRMHEILGSVWTELERVLVPGGIACINIGDATRTLDESFRLYPNHARLIEWFADNGFDVLPPVLWHKPSNRVTKFMGSGTLPPNAYVTLEHEYLLVFRNGTKRQFPPGADRRYESAFFWEERNEWFSDIWTDIGSETQTLADEAPRERAGAFPLTLPYRLINMFSVYGDTVLDPFWGTGTTTLAAMLAARDSIGYELDGEFLDLFDERIESLPAVADRWHRDRLARHAAFVAERDEPPGYEATNYDTRVITQQERDIQLYTITDVTRAQDTYYVTHHPFQPTSIDGT